MILPAKNAVKRLLPLPWVGMPEHTDTASAEVFASGAISGPRLTHFIDKIQYKVEKAPLFKYALEQHLELYRTSWGDFLAYNGFSVPSFKMLKYCW